MYAPPAGYNGRMNEQSQELVRQPSATDRAFNLASIPVRECRGDLGSIACVLLAAFTIVYVFAFLPLAFVFKWVAANRQATPTDRPKRRWFRFSLRTLFVVVTLAAIPLGWLTWQLHIVRERKAIHAELQREGLKEFTNYLSLNRAVAAQWKESINKRFAYVRISRVRRLLGDEPILMIYVPDTIEPQLLTRIEHAFPEAQILVGKDGIQGDGFRDFRDSLYAPSATRLLNRGTIFKTGLK